MQSCSLPNLQLLALDKVDGTRLACRSLGHAVAGSSLLEVVELKSALLTRNGFDDFISCLVKESRQPVQLETQLTIRVSMPAQVEMLESIIRQKSPYRAIQVECAVAAPKIQKTLKKDLQNSQTLPWSRHRHG